MASIPSGADHRPVACGQSVDDVKANERVRRQLGHGPEYVQVGGHASGSRTRSRGSLSPDHARARTSLANFSAAAARMFTAR
jgi:hypothetical protein